MSWQLRIPYRDRDEPLDAGSIWALPKLLDSDEDARVTRELLALVCVSGARTVGQVIDVVDSLDADDRRLFIDACRKSAGLRTATEIDARRAYELANAANQARGNPMLPYCAHCNAVPLTETGSLAETRAVRWHCPAHEHLAEPGDLEDRPAPWRYTDCGTIIEAPSAAARRATNRRNHRDAASECGCDTAFAWRRSVARTVATSSRSSSAS